MTVVVRKGRKMHLFVQSQANEGDFEAVLVTIVVFDVAGLLFLLTDVTLGSVSLLSRLGSAHRGPTSSRE
jgi:hypothetical protein